MTDQRFTELLGKQLTGEISPEESNEMELFLDVNASYRQEYKTLKTYFEKGESSDDHVEEVFNRIKSKIAIPEQVEDEAIVKPIKSTQSSNVWLKIAAVFILFIGGVAIYNTYFHDQLKWQSISAGASEKKNITLADGTLVNLNAVSQLKYPLSFKNESREVYLSGEAFFDVKKDVEHPFIIHTDKIQVKVLGTAFDVKAYDNDGLTEVTLIRGRVEIKLKQNNNNSTPFVLNPNEKFVLTNQDNKAQLSKLTYFSTDDLNSIVEISWMNRELVLKNNDFASISRLFERWYGVKVVFKDEALKSFKFTGKFKEESITEALTALQLIEHFNYKVQGKIVYLYN